MAEFTLIVGVTTTDTCEVAMFEQLFNAVAVTVYCWEFVGVGLIVAELLPVFHV